MDYIYLEITLVCVPNPGAVFVKLFHHRHGNQGEGRVHVSVLCIDQDSDFVLACLKSHITLYLFLRLHVKMHTQRLGHFCIAENFYLCDFVEPSQPAE